MIGDKLFSPIEPVQSLPSNAARYAHELSQELRVDPNMVACAMVSTGIVATLGGVECIVDKDYTVPGILWVLVGAPSGSGKSPAFDRVQGVLQKIFQEKVTIPIEEVLEIESRQEVLRQRIKNLKREGGKMSSEGCEDILSDLVEAKKELQSLTVPVSPVIDRISLHAFTRELAKRKGVMAAFGAEGALLPSLSMVSPEILQPLLKSWLGEDLIETSKRYGEVCVPFPQFNISVGWQTYETRKLLSNEKYIGIGLTARFLYYEVNPLSKPYAGRLKLSDESRSWWNDVLSSLVDIGLGLSFEKKISLVLSQEAKDWLDSFKCDQSFVVEALAGVQEFLSKREHHAIRLAIALHCLECIPSMAKAISGHTMLQACALTNYFLDQHRRVQVRSRDAKVRKIAFGLCQLYSKSQYGIINPGACFATRDLAHRIGATKKAVVQAMHWLAERELFAPMRIQLANGKTEDGWIARRFLNTIYTEEMLP